jgi:hypothetical protein
MTIGAVARKTANFLFNIIDFDVARWHTYEHENWDSLDDILNGLAASRDITGVWSNALVVAAGDRYIDSADGSVWIALVAHTTASSPTTFAADRGAHPTYWLTDSLADLSVSTAKIQNGAVTLPKMADIATARLLGRATAGTGAVEALTLTQVKALLGDYPALNGECRLTRSGSDLILLPYNGNKLRVNGVACTVPDAGVTLAPPSDTVTMTIASPAVVTRNSHGLVAGTPIRFATTGALPTGVGIGSLYYVIAAGLTANTFQFSTTPGGAAINTSGSQSGVHTLGTVRFIYATASAGVVNALEASLTGHANSTTTGNNGTEIKSGDDSRSLVGMAFDFGNSWADTTVRRLVRSWFNRGVADMTNAFTAQRTTVALSVAEVNNEIRCEFLSFADDVAWAVGSAFMFNSGANTNSLTVSIDGVAPTTYGASFGTNGSEISHPITSTLTEGFHYATVFGSVSAGTGTMGTATGVFGSLKVQIRN